MKFGRRKNLTNLHFCRFDELKVDEKLGLANINIALNQQKFDELNIDDSYQKFVKFFLRQNFLILAALTFTASASKWIKLTRGMYYSARLDKILHIILLYDKDQFSLLTAHTGRY